MSVTKTTQPPAPTDDNGAAVIRPTLHHVGNQTRRMGEMLRWYRNVLGQEVVHAALPPATPAPMTWTSNDAAHHRMGFFGFANVQGDYDNSTPGVQHVAWEYDSVDDLLASWERLCALGIRPMFAVDHGISFAIYYRDPDGNTVELLADAFGDWAKSKREFAESPRVHAAPGGTPVDPARLLAARRGGMSLEELHAQAWDGEFRPDGGGASHALTREQTEPLASDDSDTPTA